MHYYWFERYSESETYPLIGAEEDSPQYPSTDAPQPYSALNGHHTTDSIPVPVSDYSNQSKPHVETAGGMQSHTATDDKAKANSKLQPVAKKTTVVGS